MVLKAVKSHGVCRRLLTVPGVGPVTALAFATDPPPVFGAIANWDFSTFEWDEGGGFYEARPVSMTRDSDLV